GRSRLRQLGGRAMQSPIRCSLLLDRRQPGAPISCKLDGNADASGHAVDGSPTAAAWSNVARMALSYAHGTSSVPLLGETIGEVFRRTAERFPEREALVVRSQGFRASYRALWDAADQVARGLLAMNIERGDRVGVWSPNRFEWVVLQYATARIGAIL